jgi:2-keto-4-pentenoate hydratase/2-oxohepta-3-ene-1,7-dioic acid hydratase in catechol pathway
MRLATLLDGGRPSVAILREGRYLPLSVEGDEFGSLRAIAASGRSGLARIRAWADGQPETAYRALEMAVYGPAIPDPGAIYTVGLNYAAPGEPAGERPPRPLIYAKLPTAVAAHGGTVRWDRALTQNVDPECELGVVIGKPADAVSPDDAMGHVFGYTCVDDISSRDPWLDGDQWLLGKSLAGFCPVGPCVVTADELSPDNLRLGCTINGQAVQHGTTALMRFSIAEVISYISNHTVLRTGDLIATGTPARLDGPLGPERRLQSGDVVTVWIERIGELTTTIA